MLMLPASGWRRPARVRSSVLLPAPLQPMMLQHWPLPTCQSRPSISTRWPALNESWWVWIMLFAQPVQLIQEYRRTDQRRDGADRQLLRCDDGARQRVGQYQEGATGQCRGGSQ